MGEFAANTVSWQHFVRIVRRERLKNPYRDAKIEERKALNQADKVTI